MMLPPPGSVKPAALGALKLEPWRTRPLLAR